MQEIIQVGLLLALLSAATIKQIWDIQKGGRAAPLSFAIWTAVNVVSVSAQLATQPAIMALLLPFGQLLSMGLILVVAARAAGRNNKVTPSQWLAVVLCVVGLGAWLVSRDPMYAILGNMVANFAGVLPTWEQAWWEPRSISRGYWLIEGSTVAMGLIIIGLYAPGHVASLVPQLTGACICWSILAICALRSRRKGWAPREMPESAVE